MKNAGWLLLAASLFFSSGPARAEEASVGTVAGQIGWPGVATCRGHAALWPVSGGRVPDPRRYSFAPATVKPLRPDGSFVLEAPAGRYYVGAVLRLSGDSGVGPPAPGDVVFMTPAPDGSPLAVEVKAGETVGVGRRQDGWIFTGQAPLAGPAVVGCLRDPEGKPAAGLLVFAFDEPQMSGRPVAVSGRSDAEGRFLLRFDGGGRVWLRVMENVGGRPQEGGYMGVYGGRNPAPLDIPSDGTGRSDIEIEVIPLPPVKKETGRRRTPAAG